jgi:hypothetical protein
MQKEGNKFERAEFTKGNLARFFLHLGFLAFLGLHLKKFVAGNLVNLLPPLYFAFVMKCKFPSSLVQTIKIDSTNSSGLKKDKKENIVVRFEGIRDIVTMGIN